MDENFNLRAALKSDDELHSCIDNREKYLPESVEAAVAELQSRGVEFSEEELRVITEDMQARRELAETPSVGFGAFNSRDKNNLVEDPEAPALYSRSAIYVFSVLFSVLFGSVMLAINISKTPNKNKAILVVLFGLGYTIAILIGQNFNLSSSFSIITGIAGAYLFNGSIILEPVYWKFNTLSKKANLDSPNNRPCYSNPAGIFNNYLW
jgi:hypothetical protein